MSIQRHPTIPLTKRDSLSTDGNRVSLLSNGTAHCPVVPRAENDFINTHTELVAGKKRTPKKIKRTNSYKLALNRQSAADLIAESESVPVSKTNGKTDLKHDDRTKYHTLPRTEPVVILKHDDSRRRTTGIERKASQKSGIYPSPDTDDDQQSVQPERKKKSTFKRVKERLALTFKKDKDHAKNQSKKKGDKYKSPSRVKPHHPKTKDAFRTPNDDKSVANNGVKDIGTQTTHAQSHNGSVSAGGQTNRSHTIDRISGSSKKCDAMSPLTNKGPSFLQSIRNSFRRKNSTYKYKTDKTSTDTSPESHNNASSSSQILPTGNNQPTNQRLETSPTQPVNIPNSHQIFQDEFIDADDTITELFGSLIDPTGTSRSPATPVPKFHFPSPRSRPDKSKFKLEGLKKFKPRSFDRESPQQHSKSLKLTPPWRKRLTNDDIETDGVDYADGLPAGDPGVDEGDVSFADVSQQEKQRRMDNVARCLQAIGDSIVSRKESESAGSSSDIDGVRIHSHSRRLSELEEQLLHDLRQYGDSIDAAHCRRMLSNTRISDTVIPTVLALIRSKDYSTFRSVIQREIENTVGWDQVALYTYLIKATMSVAVIATGVGQRVKNNAIAYFTAKYRDWIQSRPKGWESIHEETDVDSELD